MLTAADKYQSDFILKEALAVNKFFTTRSSYLSLLALLSILGLITGNTGYYGFLGFLGFLGLQKEDERLNRNRGRAAYRAFTVGMAGMALLIVTISVYGSGPLINALVGIIFAAQILTYSLSLVYFENRGI